MSGINDSFQDLQILAHLTSFARSKWSNTLKRISDGTNIDVEAVGVLPTYLSHDQGGMGVDLGWTDGWMDVGMG